MAFADRLGLHFTPDLLQNLDKKGIRRAEVVLHVGAGTFKPVQAADPAEHVMHEERFIVSEETAGWDAGIRRGRNPLRRVAPGFPTQLSVISLKKKVLACLLLDYILRFLRCVPPASTTGFTRKGSASVRALSSVDFGSLITQFEQDSLSWNCSSSWGLLLSCWS